MKPHLPFIAVAALLAAGTVGVFAQQAPAAQALPPGPTTAFRSSFDVPRPPAALDVVQLVLDFAPGAFTPSHTHGGEGYVTVLEGEMLVREGGTERRYKAGETWRELPGEFAEVGNPGTAPARIMVTFLLPKGAALTTTR